MQISKKVTETILPIYESQDDYTCLYDSVTIDQEIIDSVSSIIKNVREYGDEALIDYTVQFDKVERDTVTITLDELDAARDITYETIHLFTEAAENIKKFHQQELDSLKNWKIKHSGSYCGRMRTPINRVGIYVPGGTAPYPSSVLMNVIPAQVAGVREIALVSPPDSETGQINPYIIATAVLVGVQEIYALGGAQAIAALAYGTESIQSVDKITGPGNIYVTEAKRQIFGKAGIDSLAGPSEIVIFADSDAEPEWIASDLLSQAEHDVLARAILISTDRDILKQSREEVLSQLDSLPRKEIARTSIMQKGALILAESLEQGVEIVNRLAPEHLELMVKDPENLLNAITSAGAIFIGDHTPEPVGDYWAGPNHVLPTGGNARYSSALSVKDFCKWTSIIRFNRDTLQKHADKIASFARLEGLEAHARSVERRFKREGKRKK
ncbi:MAG: histidinol dehydrogenase [bacterium]